MPGSEASNLLGERYSTVTNAPVRIRLSEAAASLQLPNASED